MSKKAKIRIIIISILVVIILLAVLKKTRVIGKEPTIKVSTELAERRTIIETVTANGKIQPEIEVKITPYISGEVIELYVNEGDQINQGDLLARIDPEIYISNFERMEANLNTQKANLANAKARLAQVNAQYVNAEINYNRNKQLWEQNVISEADWDATRSSYQVAKAEVEAAEQSVAASEYTVSSAEASVKEARENLSKTSVLAPVDGTISKLSVEKGERVAGASQFSAGTELMTIANLNLMEVNVEVNENDIVRVALWDTAVIEVDAYLDEKFKGVVTEIATSANITGVSADQVTNFNVKIRILKESYKHLLAENEEHLSPFKPGMSATVDIQTETAIDVLTIPIQAVTTRADTTGKVAVAQEVNTSTDEQESEQTNKEPEEFQEYVFLYEDGMAKLQKVTTSIQDNMYIEITDGLTEGAEVIVAPYRAVTKTLKNGDKVEKVEKDKLFTEE